MSISASEVSLRNSKRQVWCGASWSRAIVLLSVLPLAGCIASAPGSGGGGGQKQVVVTVSPASPPPIGLGVSTATTPSTQQFTAAVTGISNTAVTWSLSLAPNQVSTCTNSGTGTNGLGSFVTSGNNSMTYTAPQQLTGSPCGVAITATASDNVTTGESLASVHVVVNIAPVTDSIGQGANLQYTASVAGAPMTAAGQAVDWNATGGGAFDNSEVNNVLVNPGLYIAPQLGQGNAPITVNVTATSVFDSSQENDTKLTGILTVVANDPLGTATPTTAAAAQLQECPTFTAGLSGATCYQVNTVCDGIAPYSVYLKVNTPTTVPPLGTVIFTTGTGGSALYDNDPNFIVGSFNGGLTVVQGVLTLGYTTVQVSFGSPFNNTNTGNGWLQGPGGVRRLACRYATVADWISKNQQGLNAQALSTTPLCATGNSGGSGAMGYAATEYGLASEFALIEPTSGPVMTRIDQGCSVCGQSTGFNPCTSPPMQTNMCYTVSSGGTGQGATASIIDTAYQVRGQSTPALCTAGVGGDNSQGNRFFSDSILDDPQKTQKLPIPDPPTFVRVLFGGMDSSNAVPEGETWWSGVFPQPLTPFCVADAPHAIPSVPDGATQIVNDIQNYCRAQ